MLRIGHRGFPKVAPANTMASFRAAWDQGCDWVECDCRPSSDDAIMLAHDDSVKDRSGREWVLAGHTAEELGALDLGMGEGVPTLAELVAWAAGRVGVMADVKQGGFEREIGEALLQLPRDARIEAGADSAGRRRFRELCPDLVISTTLSVGVLPRIDELLPEIDSEAVTLEYLLISAQRIAHLHARGIRVYAWTVDDLPVMRELMAAGVDGLISNRADLLAQV